jgi:uncharacterized membrane protein YfcA
MITGLPLLILILVFFLTSGISVITGSTSLLTFALTFMSVGGFLPYLRDNVIDRKRIPWLITLTLAGSGCGGMLLLVVPQSSITVVVSIAMIGVGMFSLFYREAGLQTSEMRPGQFAEFTGYTLTFILGIYGGFFSGGYVTILTAVYVLCFRMTFLEAVATTKVANVFSSGISTLIFMRHGLIDYRLGAALGATMFIGALLGSHVARRLGNAWLRRVYMTAVWLLALKTLLYDVIAKQYTGCNTAGRHSFSTPK